MKNSLNAENILNEKKLNIKQATILITYALVAADGKIGGGAKEATQEMLGQIRENQINEFINNPEKMNALIQFIQSLSADAQEAIISFLKFIAIIDGDKAPEEFELITLLEQNTINNLLDEL